MNKSALLETILYFSTSGLRRFLYLWVKSQIIPEKIKENQLIDLNKPICFILNSESMSDYLVLQHHCKELNITYPDKILTKLSKEQPVWLYLNKKGFLQKKSSGIIPPALLQLVRNFATEDVQLIPVSVFWGRNPGKEEKSLLKLLFFDDENGGMLQRIFTIIFHGREVLCSLGEPLALQDYIKKDEEDDLTSAKKLKRTLKDHFKSQREAILGPALYDINQIMQNILTSKTIEDIITKEASSSSSSQQKIEARAKKYFQEIAANFSLNTIRFFDVLLSLLWKKIYTGVEIFNKKNLTEIPTTNTEIIYLPCHRSHMDYLLLGYILYKMGYMPPHTAAGINLNFWPVGSIFRKGGAFFIRRSFAGNRLYGAVFNEYVHYLITAGYPLSFYTEGGRSRTGYLLKPKLGLISMVLSSFLRNDKKNIVLVPVYVGYDKLMEGKSYIKEIRGRTKKAESLGQLFKATKILKSEFGKVYLSFGKPIVLNEYFESHQIDKKECIASIGKLNRLSEEVAADVMIRINKSAVISPVALFSTVILSAPNHALSEIDLFKITDILLQNIKDMPLFPEMTIIEGDTSELFLYAEKIANIGRFKHPDGDVIYLSESDKVLLTYYRNNILHITSIPSLVANFIFCQDKISRQELIDGCLDLYDFMKDDFFLSDDKEVLIKSIERSIAILTAQKLILVTDKSLLPPPAHSKEHAYLKNIAHILNQVLEKFAIFSVLLSRYSKVGYVQATDFEEECQLMFQRLSILNRIDHSNAFDKSTLRKYLSVLKEKGHIKHEKGSILVHDSMNDFVAKSLNLLSFDIKQNIIKNCEGAEN